MINVLAVDNCIASKRKTVTGPDIINAMYKLGFDLYGESSKIHLDSIRETAERDN